MQIWVITYNGSPDLKQFAPAHYPTRKIRAFESENIAWRSADRMFKDYPKEIQKNVNVVMFESKEV